MRDAPLCIDCRHFIREGMLCSHPTAFQNESVIAGTARMGDARWARHVGEWLGCEESLAVFTPPPEPSTDLLVPLEVNLAAGTYALVFGSGIFGATSYLKCKRTMDEGSLIRRAKRSTTLKR
jgi:hypothetical protein